MKGDEYSGIVFWNYCGFSKSEHDLILENVKRIILTQKGERVGEPDFGSNVKTFLFMPQVFVSDIINEIKNSIEKFEPRVKVESCTISSTEDEVVKIDLKLNIISTNESENLEVEVAI